MICIAYARGIIYWIATPSAMARNDKRECVWQRGNTFLYSLTTPPLRGTPSIEGELGVVLFIIAGGGTRDRGDPVNAICVAYARA